MRDVVMAVAMPVLMCASGIYAAGAAWWRRRCPVVPPYSQTGMRLAGERAVAVAEAVVADQYALLMGEAGDRAGACAGTGAKTSGMRHHEKSAADDRVAEGRSGEAA
ncbi:hypothetical protein V2W30_09535 [Streptomyces sp. Q6]|uniref:Uncharacterized protein n=1 Tax=Streptomyces citrinus TaxID=3118173 RepID=A0ACD5A8M0_9ACTN